MNWYIWLGLLFFGNVVGVRDMYRGVFNKNDFLVAQDHLYQEKLTYRTVIAKYVRHFSCPISYYRVLDRLAVGRGPRVELIKGGLLQKVLALKLTSVFNQPVNVVIFIACANKKEDSNEPLFTRAPWTRATQKGKENGDASNTTEAGGNETTVDNAPAGTNETAGGNETQAENGESPGEANETVPES
ncbi:uncharacterized protein LOC125226814 [Leguminivora glycinivorella]|uniref:uncharacterized protein LOC125226814 n=1 Tax=Leguminivora glycinivorella TaxID=1035111 RepID=UPI00200EBC51|nr:uncharacterized protein LOC125226814 [Leguminivora glycinivorella]